MGHHVAAAEELLRDIATDLMRVPIDENTRQLHLKALALKRVVVGWAHQPPHHESGEAMLSTLRALRIEVAHLRGSSQVRLRSTRGQAPAEIEAVFRRRAGKG